MHRWWWHDKVLASGSRAVAQQSVSEVSVQLVVTVVACIALHGFAVADPTRDHPSPTSDTSSSKEENSGTGTPARVLDDCSVAGLNGKELSNAKGGTLGRVVDVLVDTRGKLKAVVIDFGEFLGVGSKKFAVAWPELTFSENRPKLGMSIDELRVAPDYREGEPVRWTDSLWSDVCLGILNAP